MSLVKVAISFLSPQKKSVFQRVIPKIAPSETMDMALVMTPTGVLGISEIHKYVDKYRQLKSMLAIV